MNVACVRYLNTAPLVYGLESVRGLTVEPAAPSHIAGMLIDGRADIGLASIVDAVRGPVPMVVLPVGMIGCAGPTLTVRVHSDRPFDQITALHADTDSHTSVALAQVILRERFGAAVKVIDYDAREGVARQPDAPEPHAVLMIGDKVVTNPPDAEQFPHTLDLGEAWHDMTGLPFVYAAWMCRAEDWENAERRRELESAAAMLERQRLHNATRLGGIIAEVAPRHRWPIELAERYVGSLLRYDLDGEARRGAEAFIARAAALELVPPGPLRFAGAEAPV